MESKNIEFIKNSLKTGVLNITLAKMLVKHIDDSMIMALKDYFFYVKIEKIQWEAVKIILNDKDIPEEFQLFLVNHNPAYISLIDNPSYEVNKLAIIKSNGTFYNHVSDKKNQELAKLAVSLFPKNIMLVDNQSLDLVYLALDYNPMYLEHIRNQNEEICYYALKKSEFGECFKFVKKQTFKLCRIAILKDDNNIKLCKDIKKSYISILVRDLSPLAKDYILDENAAISSIETNVLIHLEIEKDFRGEKYYKALENVFIKLPYQKKLEFILNHGLSNAYLYDKEAPSYTAAMLWDAENVLNQAISLETKKNHSDFHYVAALTNYKNYLPNHKNYKKHAEAILNVLKRNN